MIFLVQHYADGVLKGYRLEAATWREAEERVPFGHEVMGPLMFEAQGIDDDQADQYLEKLNNP